uniref:Uncharacterized protein n=1 Tax=Picea glauca TaxID=3330 RepID=A0A124GMM0_PICGL|nr:hypothetical protein ABT39_MTgene1893 [Picea glauca]
MEIPLRRTSYGRSGNEVGKRPYPMHPQRYVSGISSTRVKLRFDPYRDRVML